MNQRLIDPLEPHPGSVTICGECHGGRLRAAPWPATRRCPACFGSCRYAYLPNGDRVAYDAKRKAWRRT